MRRMVKDYVEIGDYSSLDGLIDQLVKIRDSLPDSSEAEVRLRGDDIFGRHLSIGYMRQQTEDEAACEARYDAAYRDARQRELDRIHDELGFCPVPRDPDALRQAA